MPAKKKTKLKTQSKVSWINRCVLCNKVDSSGILYGEGLRHFYCQDCLNDNQERIEELEHYRQERARNAKNGKSITIKLSTFVPCKWRILDLETNEVYMPEHDGKLVRDFSFELEPPKPAKKKKASAKKKQNKTKAKAKGAR